MAPALDHRLLRQFLAVVDAGTVRGAAARLNMSQPPLTQAIRRLEENLGMLLFIREAKGMVPTEAGNVLATEARGMLARLQRAERRVQAAGNLQAPIRIGFVSAALNGALASLLRSVIAKQIARPLLHEMTTPEQVAALADGRIDVGLLHPPVDAEDLAVRSLGRDAFVAALHSEHRLASRTALSFAEIAHEPFVLFPSRQGPSLMAAIERLAFEAGATLDVAASAPRVHSQLAIVAGGLGIGLVTRRTAETIKFDGVVFVPIPDIADRLFMELALVGEEDLLDTLGPR